MSIPQPTDPGQPQPSLVDHVQAVPPDQPCPLCERTGMPFDARVSALLDQLEILQETMADVRKAALALAS